MLAAALALAAAVSWGIGDFLGGFKSRTLRPVAVLIVAQPVGAALLAIWVGARGQGPPGPAVLWACLSAVLGTIGLVAFYRGMAAGALSIVAPIAGAGAAIPVIWGLARGDHPSAYQDLGFVAAIVGVVLASFERRAEVPALAAIGVLDTGGNVFFAAASENGLVSVVSILASLYPVVTVLLARAVLHERVHRSQELGIALALSGIVLISAG